MPDPRDLTPTRSVHLELRDERRMVREGYGFLDEKRIMLASEILDQLRHYDAGFRRYTDCQAEAAAALGAAAARHGLDGLAVYPARDVREATLEIDNRRFLGVAQIAAKWDDTAAGATYAPVNPSPEARHCAALFARLLGHAAELAAIAGNLRRLAAEYGRTERRARALENVVLPEIDESVRFVGEQLDAVDQEEAIRVRFAGAGNNR
jgi:V/A-type H+-transporting ATPase subunit D